MKTRKLVFILSLLALTSKTSGSFAETSQSGSDEYFSENQVLVFAKIALKRVLAMDPGVGFKLVEQSTQETSTVRRMGRQGSKGFRSAAYSSKRPTKNPKIFLFLTAPRKMKSAFSPTAKVRFAETLEPASAHFSASDYGQKIALEYVHPAYCSGQLTWYAREEDRIVLKSRFDRDAVGLHIVDDPFREHDGPEFPAHIVIDREHAGSTYIYGR